MIGWLITLGILLLIGFTRVRLRLCYDDSGIDASMRIGFVRLRLYPRAEKEKKPKEPREIIDKREKKPRREKKKFGIKIDSDTVRDLLAIAKTTLRRTVKLLRFELIELRFTSGGDDAAKAAIHYGKLNQIIYMAYPLLKNNFRIKKTSINIYIDYSLPKSTYYGKLRLSVSIGRAVVFGFASLGALLKLYLRHRNTQESEEITNGRRQAQAG